MKGRFSHLLKQGGWALLLSWAWSSSPALSQPAPDLSPIEQAVSHLKTPEDIARYAWKNFRFERDQRHFGKEEYWQSPEEFIRNKAGDCEDFALFTQTLLKRNGHPAFLLNVYGGRFAHTVVVFKRDGKYHAVDGASVIRKGFDRLEDLARYVYPFWDKMAIVAYSPATHDGRVLMQFYRMRSPH